MSFSFTWPTFSPAFYSDARELLAQALNKGEKPPVIAGDIEVKTVDLGTVPPDLEILEIGDLTKDRFRGIFRLTYAGDAYIELQTSVQANPLTDRKPALDILSGPSMLFANAPLIVPMRLRLSDLRLRAIIVLVVSRQKGITLVFKNDPLESVNVSSTFDSVTVLQSFIQSEIEGQLRELFRTDLPAIIHRLSQRWLAETAARAGARHGFDPTATIQTKTAPPHTAVPIASTSVPLAAPLLRRAATAAPLSSSPPRLRRSDSVADEIEAYDPTYGLRPQGLPSQPSFDRYNRLAEKRAVTRGLGDLLAASEPDDDAFADSVADDSFDHVGLRDLVDDGSTPLPRSQSPSVSPQGFPWSAPPSARGSGAFDVFPAIGGGLISRPRVIHTQSQVLLGPSAIVSGSLSRAPSSTTARVDQASDRTRKPTRSVSSHAISGHRPGSSFTPLHTPGLTEGSVHSSYFPPASSRFTRSSSWASTPQSSLFLPTQASSFSSLHPSTGPSSPEESFKPSGWPSHEDASSDDDEPAQPHVAEPLRRPASPPPFLRGAPKAPIDPLNLPDPADAHYGPTPGITLNPLRNDSCAHLATLATSNQTLSPFTRSTSLGALSRPAVLARASTGGPLLSAVRTVPDRQPPVVRGRRRRLHVVGEAARKQQQPISVSAPTSVPSSSASSSSGRALAMGRSRRPSPAPWERIDEEA